MFENLLEKPGFWSIRGPNNDVVLSSRIRLARNIKTIPFPNRLDDGGDQFIRLVVEKFISESNFSDELLYIDLASVDAHEKRLLRERNLITFEMEESGNSAVLIDKNDDFSILINEEDHFRIQVIKSGLQLHEAYRVADHVEDELGRFIHFAFSDEYGYLTACPSNVGTGLRASVMLHLPALAMRKKIERLFDDIRDRGFDIKGTTGDSVKTIGNLYQVSNRVSIGKSEIDLVEVLDDLATGIIHFEDSERDDYLSESRYELEDKIWRSYGVLKYSRRISFVEAMGHLSSVRLGVVLALIRNVDLTVINDCMVNIQQSHLQRNYGRIFENKNEDDEIRAEYIRGIL